MTWFNLGKKDEYGKQRRIEHRGKYLRASRTGGVSLRAQTRAAGVNLTANTSRGFRVSHRLGKGTQVALQNGRFVLRGRYGRGPTKLNVSKSGATVSTRNTLGTFNWIKPNRSSAKIGGVQVRGKNAAYAQMVFMAVSLVVEALKLAILLAIAVGKLLLAVLGVIGRLLLATPYAVEVLRRRWRNFRLSRRARAIRDTAPLAEWHTARMAAALALILGAWGRGQSATEQVPGLRERLAQGEKDYPGLAAVRDALDGTAEALEQLRRRLQAEDSSLVILAALAERASEVMDDDLLPELLLEADELTLQDGSRTLLQNRMLAIFSDFAGLKLKAD